jgi:hypothetical protein
LAEGRPGPTRGQSMVTSTADSDDGNDTNEDVMELDDDSVMIEQEGWDDVDELEPEEDDDVEEVVSKGHRRKALKAAPGKQFIA